MTQQEQGEPWGVGCCLSCGRPVMATSKHLEFLLQHIDTGEIQKAGKNWIVGTYCKKCVHEGRPAKPEMMKLPRVDPKKREEAKKSD